MSSIILIVASILLTATISLSSGVPIAKRAVTQTITYNQFLGLQIGWTLQQITAYLNNNLGIVQTEMMIGNIDLKTIQYTNTNPIGAVILLLTNNQLTTKSQSGLNQNQYPISRTQYDQITMGMTSAQVTSLVGSEGQVISQSTSSVESFGYNGNTNSYAIVQVTFSQGIVTSKLEIGM
jgi:hypothetical protein